MASRLERLQQQPEFRDDSGIDVEAILRKFKADDEHKIERLNHKQTKQRDVIGRSRVERDACVCGWRGEWFRIRFTT